MLFIMSADGTITQSLPFALYQGTARAHAIELLAPFPSFCTVEITFKLPNGITIGANYAGKYKMDVTRLNNIVDCNGKGYNAWRYLVPYAITAQAGELAIQFSVFRGREKLTSSTTKITIGQGAEHIEEEYDEADFSTIQAYAASAAQSAEDAVEAAENASTGRGIYLTNEALTEASAGGFVNQVVTGSRNLYSGDFVFTTNSLLFRVTGVGAATYTVDYLFSFHGSGAKGADGLSLYYSSQTGQSETQGVELNLSDIAIPEGRALSAGDIVINGDSNLFAVTYVGTSSAVANYLGTVAGRTGAAAGFGSITADATEGVAGATVEVSGEDTAKNFDFRFTIPRGNKGDTGLNLLYSTQITDEETTSIYLSTIDTDIQHPVKANDTIVTASGDLFLVYSVETETATVVYVASLRGEQGETGAAATVSVGTVTTLSAGSSATVENLGTEKAAVLGFGIPQGLPGAGASKSFIINGDFTRASNQRGQSTYTSQDYGVLADSIDCWYLHSETLDAASITVSTDGVHATVVEDGVSLFCQYIENGAETLRGKTVTLSVETSLVDDTSDVYIATNTFTVPEWDDDLYDGPQVFLRPTVTSTFNIYKPQDGVPFFRIVCADGISDLYLRRAKLEIGTQSTLSLDPPGDYGETLTKCQRYVKSIGERGKALSPIGIVESDTRIRFPVPVSMRTIPSCDFTGVYAVRDGVVIPVNAWTVETNGGNVDIVANGAGFVRPYSAPDTREHLDEPLIPLCEEEVQVYDSQYYGYLTYTPVVANTVWITHEGISFHDNGVGLLLDSQGDDVGYIDYTTGEVSLFDQYIEDGTVTFKYGCPTLLEPVEYTVTSFPIVPGSVTVRSDMGSGNYRTFYDDGAGKLLYQGVYTTDEMGTVDYNTGEMHIDFETDDNTATVTYKSAAASSKYGVAELISTTGTGNVVLSAEL